MTTLFIHGFGSSGRSGKVDQIRAILGGEVPAPSLTHRPEADLAMLSALMAERPVSTLVGSSLGGFYALLLAQRFGASAVLVNPSLHPDETTRRYLGMNRNFDTGEAFEGTDREVDELRAMCATSRAALDPATSRVDWSRVLVLLGAQDDVIDPQTTAREIERARVVVDAAQDHGFVDLMPHADAIRRVVAWCGARLAGAEVKEHTRPVGHGPRRFCVICARLLCVASAAKATCALASE